MPLAAGQRLLHYRLEEPVGKGGMASVWRAEDLSLRRPVALKFLFDETRDSEGFARLRREGRFLARLQHPCIASILGVEEWQGGPVLVLEYVPGETLAERLERGPLPLRECLRAALQIAEAIEAAHDAGIVHRDLKPANIKITPSGDVKVLDFGLAKGVGSASRITEATSVNASFDGTLSGTILGTVSYMSPEQARGQRVDRKTDIWAFGCLLFEALAGRRAFAGSTPSDTLVDILERQPDWDALPQDTPHRIRRLMSRCLRKPAEDRLRHAGDAAIEIREAIAELPPEGATERGGDPKRRGWTASRSVAILVVIVAAASALVAWVFYGHANPRNRGVWRSPARFSLELGIGGPLSPELWRPFAISPDGRSLLHAGREDGRLHMLLRDMGTGSTRPLDEDRALAGPSFSRDGLSLSYVARGALTKALLAGGSPIRLAAAVPLGTAWTPAGAIVFCPSSRSGLAIISAAEGDFRPLTELDPSEDEVSHRWPNVLPDGRVVLFSRITLRHPSFEGGDIMALNVETGESKLVVEHGTQPVYAASGHLVFVRQGTLMAAPFDSGSLELGGEPVSMIKGVGVDPWTGGASYSLSDEGTLVYAEAGPASEAPEVRWVSAARSPTARTLLSGRHETPRLSPDGRRLALGASGVRGEILVGKLDGEEFRSLTGLRPGASFPVWAPAGDRLAFAVPGAAGNEIHALTLSEQSAQLLIMGSGWERVPEAWSPDGRALVFSERSLKTGLDLWSVDLDSRMHEPRPLRRTSYDEAEARFSPDGRWISFTSDASGREEVYVQAYPGPGGRRQVSTRGGRSPVWARDMSRLFYLNAGGLFAVDTRLAGTPVLGAPRLVLAGEYGPCFDVGPDPASFVVTSGGGPGMMPRLEVALGWFRLLGQLSDRQEGR